MARGARRIYRLTAKAEADLAAIWTHTARTWSADQADAYLRGLDREFAILCQNPQIVRERTEIDPPVRLHPWRSHLVIYRIEGDRLTILRIVHNRRHWQSLLNG